MGKVQIGFQWPVELRDRVDADAALLGVSRTQFVIDRLEEALNGTNVGAVAPGEPGQGGYGPEVISEPVTSDVRRETDSVREGVGGVLAPAADGSEPAGHSVPGDTNAGDDQGAQPGDRDPQQVAAVEAPPTAAGGPVIDGLDIGCPHPEAERINMGAYVYCGICHTVLASNPPTLGRVE